LARSLRIVFATFAEDVSADVQGGALLFWANSGDWQQTLTIHPNNNRGTETQQSTSNFDANGNLLVLNNIGTLHWHYKLLPVS
jgi:hypothetical protein